MISIIQVPGTAPFSVESRRVFEENLVSQDNKCRVWPTNESTFTSSVGHEPAMLEHRSMLGSSRLEHERVIPCAISCDPVGFVYINPAPASPSSHLPLSHFNEYILLPRPKRYQQLCSSLQKYPGSSSAPKHTQISWRLEHARTSWRLESAQVRSSQGLTRLEPSSPGVPRAEHARAEVSARLKPARVQHYSHP